MDQIPSRASGTSPPFEHATHHHLADLTLFTPVGETVVVEADLRYDTTDPLAVTLSFHHDGVGLIDWVFARQLLFEGLAGPAGEGDVRLRPHGEDPGLVWLHLESPFGRAELTACRRQLTEFLDCTTRLVRSGSEPEWIAIDSSITRLLSGEP
ncbi:SsgA family sporulation/cell division regulator [Amycolatopsis thailandensis]|uniref:SsgA family sporulation/cell division regulator n=1 Tax=Amycolatopsis thailandensis TaxID=589330 RepID=UPI00362B458D